MRYSSLHLVRRSGPQACPEWDVEWGGGGRRSLHVRREHKGTGSMLQYQLHSSPSAGPLALETGTLPAEHCGAAACIVSGSSYLPVLRSAGPEAATKEEFLAGSLSRFCELRASLDLAYISKPSPPGPRRLSSLPAVSSGKGCGSRSRDWLGLFLGWKILLFS